MKQLEAGNNMEHIYQSNMSLELRSCALSRCGMQSNAFQQCCNEYFFVLDKIQINVEGIVKQNMKSYLTFLFFLQNATSTA